ncbi:lipoprotein [Mycoplasmoides pneumoniae]
MNKKRLLPKASLGALFMLFGTALTACSNSDFQTNLTSLNQLREGVNQNTSLTQDKKAFVESLQKAFENNPEGTTKVLLDAWKFTLLDSKILESKDPSRFVKAFGSGKSNEDVEPNASVKGLRLDKRFEPSTANIINNVISLNEQKVEAFNIQYKSRTSFKVQVKLNAQGKYQKSQVQSYLQQIGLNDGDLKQESGTLSADLIFTYTLPESNLFSRKNFDTLMKKINFNTTLKIDMVGKDEIMKKILQSTTFTNNLSSQTFQDQSIDLLPYLLYSIL